MTPTDLSTRKIAERIAVLALLVLAAAMFGVAPIILELGASGTETWYVVGWLVVPFLAGSVAWRTAAKCDGSAQKAWRRFAAFCFLWTAGTLAWASYGWVGAVLPFPSLADALYFMAVVVFMNGMYHYSVAGSGTSRIRMTNFALAISSVVAIGFLLYFPLVASSPMGRLGAALAFTYPALALSTFVFGLICYGLYVPRRRRFPFLLITAAAGIHAVANFFYGLDLLGQSNVAGTFYDTLWIVAYALVGWAALEHVPATGLSLEPESRTEPSVRPGEALIPALSLTAILVTGMAVRWPDLHADAVVVVPVMFGFAALLAMRERAVFAAQRNITSRLAESEARLSSVLDNTTDGVMVLDRQWRITFANRNAVAMLFSDRPFLGLVIWDVLSPKQGNEFYRHYCIAIEQQAPVDFEAYFAPLDIWFEVHAYPTSHDVTVFFGDVTERRRLREELVRLSQHDPLTGLANRALFLERLTSGLQSGRRDLELTLVLIDLDDFKDVNDSLGHLAGDGLLQAFAGRLNRLVRQGDTVARFGGDEFAVIQPGAIEPGGGAELARRIFEFLSAPFDIDGTRVTLSVSIGLAMAPQHGARPDELIRNADLALYRAKESKGSGLNYCIFEPGLDDHPYEIKPLRLGAARAAPRLAVQIRSSARPSRAG